MTAADTLNAFLKTASSPVSDARVLTHLFDVAGLTDHDLILRVAMHELRAASDILVYLQGRNPDLFYAYLDQIARKDPGLLARLRLPYTLIDLHQLQGYLDDGALKGFESVPAYYFLLDHDLREGKIEAAGLLLELEGMVEIAFTPPGKERTPAGFIDAFLTDDFLRRAAARGEASAPAGDRQWPVSPAIAQAFRRNATVLDRFVTQTLDEMAEEGRKRLNAQIAEHERDLATWRSRTQTLSSQAADLRNQINAEWMNQLFTRIKFALTLILTVVNVIASIIGIVVSVNYSITVILAYEHPKFLLIVAVFAECFCFFLLSQLNFAALLPLLLAQLLAVLARIQWPSTEALYAAYSARILGRPILREVA
jgi:hypothetical protein